MGFWCGCRALPLLGRAIAFACFLGLVGVFSAAGSVEGSHHLVELHLGASGGLGFSPASATRMAQLAEFCSLTLEEGFGGTWGSQLPLGCFWHLWVQWAQHAVLFACGLI